MKNLLFFLLALNVFVACTPSTEIVKTWQQPGSSVVQSAQNKTFVVAMVKDEASRRIIEEQLVKRLNGNAVASYTVLTPEMLKAAKEEVLVEKLKQGEFTHVLLMRLGDVEKETTYVPGTTTVYYGGYGRYYGYGAGYYSNPGYYTTDKNYFVETTVYTINPDKLVWTGTTKSVNPSNIEKTVNEIADVVTKKMKADGFLQ